MKCSEARKALSPYMDGMITGKKRDKIEKHLASCRSCREELKALKEVREELGQLGEVDVPADFLDMIHARIEQESPARRLWRKLFTFTARRIPIELAAAVSMIVLAIVLIRVLPLIRPLQHEQDQIERAEVPNKSEKVVEVDDSFAPFSETDFLIKNRTERVNEVDAEGQIPEDTDTAIVREAAGRPTLRILLTLPPPHREEVKSVDRVSGDKAPSSIPKSERESAETMFVEPSRIKGRRIDQPEVGEVQGAADVSEEGFRRSHHLVSFYEQIEELVAYYSGKVVSSDPDMGITAEIPAVSYEQFLQELSRFGQFERPELYKPLNPTDVLLLSIAVSP